MNKYKRMIIKTPLLGRMLLMLHRAKIGLSYFLKPFANLFTWLFSSRETTNFTYDLTDDNKQYLAALIADITDGKISVIMDYIDEIENDTELRKHIQDATAGSEWRFMADREVRFGRRVGWYALARVLKPKVIIETGVDKGLGACLLTAALRQNAKEGQPGKYYGTDINPEAGYLLSGDYENFGEILYGDSITSLEQFTDQIDLFINDSDHSASYEAKEYLTIADKLSEKAVILGDNSHCTDKLFQFSIQTNRQFIYFQEKPKDHWYPGGGIGISFRR